MTALIFLFMLINFADKVVVGLAAQPIMADLNLKPEQFGLIGSSFFFLFALSAVIVGFITNRVQTRHTLLVMAIVWSLVQFPMLGTVSLEVLIACRIILGAGEGPASPVAAKPVSARSVWARSMAGHRMDSTSATRHSRSRPSISAASQSSSGPVRARRALSRQDWPSGSMRPRWSRRRRPSAPFSRVHPIKSLSS